FQNGAQNRLYWRVIVSTAGTIDGSRSSRPLSWHLTACTDAASDAAHCRQGRELRAGNGDPDGHCLIDGECARCAMLARAGEEPATAPPKARGDQPIDTTS